MSDHNIRDKYHNAIRTRNKWIHGYWKLLMRNRRLQHVKKEYYDLLASKQAHQTNACCQTDACDDEALSTSTDSTLDMRIQSSSVGAPPHPVMIKRPRFSNRSLALDNSIIEGYSGPSSDRDFRAEHRNAIKRQEELIQSNWKLLIENRGFRRFEQKYNALLASQQAPQIDSGCQTDDCNDEAPSTPTDSILDREPSPPLTEECNSMAKRRRLNND